jgi:trimeric autotransporter adhesin
MRLSLKYIGILIVLATSYRVTAQGIINTVAGNGITQYIGDGSPATNFSLGGPRGVWVDRKGAVYVANYYTTRISKIYHDTMSTIMGNGSSTYTGDGGQASAATFKNPDGICMDTAGNFYITDEIADVVRKVDKSTGVITTVCGDGGGSFGGDGGPATGANMELPRAACVDLAGNIYVPDYGNHRIRKVNFATGIISTVAGNGTNGYSGDGSAATSAQISYPTSVSTDINGNIYFSERGNHTVRKITVSTGIISTVAGRGTQGYTGDGGLATNAELNEPSCVYVDKHGFLYITDYGNNVVRAVTDVGFISTIAGNGSYGYAGDGGPAINASFLRPSSIFVDDSGYIYIADGDNSAIRKMTPIVFSGAGVKNISASSFNVYPNPSTGRFTVYTGLQMAEGTVEVFNMLGQSVHKTNISGNETRVDILGNAAGIYFVQFTTQDGSATQKIIVR